MTHLLLYNQGILKEGTSHPHCSSEPCELHGCGNQHPPCTHMQSGCAVCTRLMQGTCMLTWKILTIVSIFSHVRNRYSVQVHLLTASFGWTYLTGNVFLKLHLYTNQQTSFLTHPHLFPRLHVSVGPAGLYRCPAWAETDDFSQVSLSLFCEVACSSESWYLRISRSTF